MQAFTHLACHRLLNRRITGVHTSNRKLGTVGGIGGREGEGNEGGGGGELYYKAKLALVAWGPQTHALITLVRS